MKKIVLFLAFALGMTQFTTAQEGKAILAFDEGKTLSIDDIGFLDLVSKGADEKTRGVATKVSVKGSTFEAGMTISKADADNINAMVNDYFKKAGDKTSFQAKPEVKDGKARGCGYYCYYYYRYWDTYYRRYRYRYVYYWCCR